MNNKIRFFYCCLLAAIGWTVNSACLLGQATLPVASAVPSEFDQQLLRAIPDDCLAISLWDYSQPIPENSSNQTDQLLSEPAVRQFIDSGQAMIFKIAQSAAEELPGDVKKDAQQLIEVGLPILLQGTGGFILKDFEIEAGGLAKFESISLYKTGNQSDIVIQSLKSLFGNMIGAARSGPIADVEFHRFTSEAMEGQYVLVGHFNGYLMIGTSVELVASTIRRMQAEAVSPIVQKLMEQLPLDRRSNFSYVNIGQVRNKLMELAPPELQGMIVSMGFDNLESYMNSSGYNATMTTNRTFLSFDGQPRGLFALDAGRGLEMTDLTHVPADALFAFATTIDAGELFNFFFQQMETLNPRWAEDLLDFFDSIRRNTQVDIRRDLIGQIGSVMTVHNAAGDGWFSGLVMSAELKDAEKFANALYRLHDSVVQESDGYRDAPRFINRRVGEATITTLVVPDAPVPFEISVCIHKGKLLVSLFPQTIVSLINETPNPLFADGLPKPSGAGDASSDSLRSIFWMDTQKAFELVYPMVQMMMAMRHQLADELPADISYAVAPLIQNLFLPPARTIHKHLAPTISTVRRMPSGIEIETQQTLPAMDPTLVVPVAIGFLLPAVQQVRMAARRAQTMNNVRQIAIAMHNYESAFMKFPSGFGPAGRNGKHPVSWRVKILPFIEQNNLYEMYRMDEPWDSEHNLQILDKMPTVYRSPNSKAGANETTYLVIGGRNGIFGKDEAGNAIETKIGQITDGTSNTIMIVAAGDDLAVPWTKPDEGIDPDDFAIWDFMGQFPGGFIVGMADGSVRFIGETVSEVVLKNLFQKNDGSFVSPDDY